MGARKEREKKKEEKAAVGSLIGPRAPYTGQQRAHAEKEKKKQTAYTVYKHRTSMVHICVQIKVYLHAEPDPPRVLSQRWAPGLVLDGASLIKPQPNAQVAFGEIG